VTTFSPGLGARFKTGASGVNLLFDAGTGFTFGTGLTDFTGLFTGLATGFLDGIATPQS
jgi:hypothetical protein